MLDKKLWVKSRPTILYLVYNYPNKTRAVGLNTDRRKSVLERLGYKVIVYSVSFKFHNFLNDLVNLITLSPKVDFILLRIDGSGVTDKFTLLKLIKPSLVILWEIHGLSEEKYLFDSPSLNKKYWSFINTWKRKMYSYFCDAYIFISKTLGDYSSNKLANRKRFIIPNFIDSRVISEIKPDKTNSYNISSLEDKVFKVVWAGNAHLPWHGLDIIESVARKIYKVDKNVIFFLVGSHPWHLFSWQKNIRLIDDQPYEKLLSIIIEADLGLAIYRLENNIPLYFFPLKILDYMCLEKPLIATGSGAIKEIIRNNESGFLTNNSPEDIVKKILLVKSRRSLAKKLGLNARKTVFAQFSDKNALEKYKNLFASLNRKNR